MTASKDHIPSGLSPQIKSSKLAAIVSGKQPSKKVPNLIQEFSQVVAIKGIDPTFSFSMTQKRMLTKCYKFIDNDTEREAAVIHVGAKLLRRTSTNGGVSGASISVEKQQQLGDSSSISSCSCKLGCADLVTCKFSTKQHADEAAFGCPWEPVTFVNEVCKVGHPQSFVSALPKEVA